ncbi:hypothetical protein MHJ85_02400 [Brevibacterium ravenspurgense]|uniref:hypothetical protein n=1 Tax=Brevibacterium ravenspurgense TaxID=479117 RepID=UPI001EF26B27|nr:hypothetical protein [Brevibacterium ravenspurgense]MCG7300109.1 hypothetical protein [Brevibacterium ravenspurgense]
MRTTKVRTVIAAAAVAASLGLTGCSVDFNTGSDDKKETSEQSEQNDSSDSSGSGSGEAASQSGGDSDTADSEDSGSGSEAAASGDVLAEVEVPAKVDGDKDAKLKVRLISVKRNQQTVEAVYGFTLETQLDKETDLYSVRGTGFQPYAVDTKNFNKHKMIRDLSDSYFDIKLTPGTEARSKAAFGAPPEDVDTMDVFLWEGEPLVKGVKIQ